jgi:hypothetical protein
VKGGGYRNKDEIFPAGLKPGSVINTNIPFWVIGTSALALSENCWPLYNFVREFEAINKQANKSFNMVILW